MTGPTSDEVLFQEVLEELRQLISDFEIIGVDVVLIGGQVIALESLAAGGDGVIQVRTPTDITVPRGYSMEPDLLFDVGGGAAQRADAIPVVLRDRGFTRVRTHRWRKETLRGEVLIDMFVPPGTDDADNPAGFTELPAGNLALFRPIAMQVQLPNGVLTINIPDPVGFLAMKLEAKLRLRPDEVRDSFDIYAYISMKGVTTVADAIRGDPNERPAILSRLKQLFGDVNSQGVNDVLTYASTLRVGERELLAQAVVDLMEDLFNAV